MKNWFYIKLPFDLTLRFKATCILTFAFTVDSRYLELGYLEFCEVRSVYLNQKYMLIAFSNSYLAFGSFLQVQITRSAK